jgi:conjugal transfer pilus assembly protein TraF
MLSLPVISSLTLLLLLLILLLPTTIYADNFFEQRYRGWLWFEEQKPEQYAPQIKHDRLPVSEQPASHLTPEQAKAEIEQFANELADLKFMMLARPTPENVRAYRDKEQQMWQQAETLHDSWDMANLLYPEQRDLINNPVNVHSVKAKRAMQEADNVQKIQQLAKEFDLVLFFSEQCQYCQLLSPVLKSFAQQYGFNIDAVSSTGSKHQYFSTYKDNGLIERLKITAFPTVIAISHDAKTAFELIRGYVSLSELEEYSVLAVKYLESLETAPQAASNLISNNLAK